MGQYVRGRFVNRLKLKTYPLLSYFAPNFSCGSIVANYILVFDDNDNLPDPERLTQVFSTYVEDKGGSLAGYPVMLDRVSHSGMQVQKQSGNGCFFMQTKYISGWPVQAFLAVWEWEWHLATSLMFSLTSCFIGDLWKWGYFTTIWKFFHVRWKILFSHGGEHMRWDWTHMRWDWREPWKWKVGGGGDWTKHLKTQKFRKLKFPSGQLQGGTPSSQGVP